MADEPWRPKEDEDDEEIEEINYKSQKDAIIIAIDVNSTMLQLPPPLDSKKADTDSALFAALKCASHLMEQRIISNPKDMMGILFFGTKQSKYPDEDDRASQGYPHCYVYVDLDIPTAEDVKALKSLIEEDEDDILIPTEDDSASMANVLFCANQLFTTRAPNFTSRRLFIITDNDNPHPDDKKSKSAAVVRAKDLYDLSVVIELFPITRNGTGFNVSKFYEDIIYRDISEEANSPQILTSTSGDGISLLKSLISNVTSKQVSKRALFSGIPFEIAPGLTITVSGYNVIHKQRPQRSCYVWLDDEKPQIAKGETAKFTEDTAETIMPDETKKAYKFGGEFVFFTPDEHKMLRDFGPPVVRILGFKSRYCIKPWESVKKATFIFPSEEHYIGSTRVFASLHKKLLKDDKVAIVWAIIRSNAKPGLFALVASQEKMDDATGALYLPAGMWLYPLPFADDLRSGPGLKYRTNPPDKMIDDLSIVVENLWLPNKRYNPVKYPNPQLQWHYRILQAMALGEEIPEVPDDATIPKYRAMNKRVGGLIKDINSAAKASVASDTLTSRPVKRELDAPNDNGPRKRAKSPCDAGGSSVSDKQLRDAVESGSVQKMTVAGLKEVLTMRGIDAMGRKADLIDKLEQWLETH
ncbi:ATP-dependent DNA helicase II subunit 1 [Ceratocystis pirilliformis]|uniref:ATP-dependent DNA helicase II subunit 1 n=1 Tax=Ceratocystis pirilliformis TaxID=259994 RepID=A0ABR3ZJ64_9PEZI